MKRLVFGCLVGFASCLTTAAFGQGGIRLIVYHVEPVLPSPYDDEGSSGIGTALGPAGERQSYHFGMGYDHDLKDRLSMGISVTMTSGALSADAGTVTVQYRSAYHLASNQEASGYFGPTVAYRRVTVNVANTDGRGSKLESSTVIPIGLRFGFRGDLRGFYADVYASLVFQLGGQDTPTVTDRLYPSPIIYALGFDMGIGWDKRSQ